MDQENILCIEELKISLENHVFRKDGCPNQRSFTLKWWDERGLPLVYFSIQHYKNKFLIENNMQLVYHIINDIKDVPLCEVCGKNPKIWNNYISGYRSVCSIKCSSLHPKVQDKRSKTNLEKYGYECVLSSPIIKEKISLTNLETYGTENPAGCQEIREKIQNTNIERYGVISTLQLTEVKEKIKITNNKKYNKDYPSQKNISNEAFDKLNNADWLFDQHINQKKFLSQIGKELGVSECTVGNYLRKFNIETCIHGGSYIQTEVENFISNYTNMESNNRTIIAPKEIDIYLPEYKLAIEFNGLYWHTDLFIDSQYHVNKLIDCEKRNIKLLQIFEDEWRQKSEIVKSIILAKLGIFDHRLFANKCHVVKQNTKIVREFVNANHIQGNVGATDYYCLYFGDELVSVASVGKSRFIQGEYELIRYCSKLNLQIVGGFSKILKRIKIDYPVLYSYTDLRYFHGNVYNTYGTYIKRTKPGYYWTDGVKRISRYKTQKNNIKNILGDKLDVNLTEDLNMRNNGFYKIYDCGNDLFLL